MMRKTKKKSGVDETNDFLSNLADVGAALTQHAMDVLSADEWCPVSSNCFFDGHRAGAECWRDCKRVYGSALASGLDPCV
jgi:hypothetical protein